MSYERALIFEREITPALRALIVREREVTEQVVQRVVRMVVASVPDYGLSTDPRMVDDLAKASWMNADLWFDALLEGRPVTPDALEPIVAFARRRVHQGISLTGLLRAYRIIARAFWLRLVEAAAEDVALKAELAAHISPFLLEHFDVVAEAIATNYIQEQSQHARWRDRLREELWTIVRGRVDDGAGFRRQAEALGIAHERPHCAVALRLTEEGRERPERYIDALLLTIARGLGTTVDALMRALHQDHLVVWVAQPANLSSIAFEKTLVDAVRAVDTRSTLAVGVGLPGVGARGWQASMDQAVRVLLTSADLARGARVVRYSAILVEDAITANANVASFVRSALDALLIDPPLLDTLRAYLDHGLHRKETAAALTVHPNTLDHRLTRIETLLDGRFTDLAWLERVHLAVRLPRTPSS